MFTHTVFGGEKDKWLIAFYGYGQSANTYQPLYELLKDSHNIIVIDNPMQDTADEIRVNDFREYLYALLEKYNIEEYNSVSYSMGSRFNLYLPLVDRSALRKMILIAPDGITYNFWNRVAISTPWGRRIFKFFVDHGTVYLNTLLLFHKIGIVNKSLYAFSKWNMRDDKARKNVYNAWMNMQFFRPKLELVNQAIEKNNIALVTYFGKNDPVIPMTVQARCAHFFPKGTHHIVDTDHNILRKYFWDTLAKELNE